MDEEQREMFVGLLKAVHELQKNYLTLSVLIVALQNLLVEHGHLYANEISEEVKKGSKITKKTILGDWKEKGWI